MAERFLALTAFLALIPAIGGSKTAWALLASYSYALCLEWLGVDFWAPQWLLADVFVLKVILSPNMTLADELIGALMLPAWFGYLQGANLNYEVGCGVVALQFLLTLPVRRWQRSLFSFTHGPMRAGKVQEATNGGNH